MAKKGKQLEKDKSPWEVTAGEDETTSIESLIQLAPFQESSDPEGSVLVSTRIPTWLNRKVIKMIELKGSPYELRSDALRDAIYLGIRILTMRHKAMGEDWGVRATLSELTNKVHGVDVIEGEVKSFIEGLQKFDDHDEQDKDQAVDYLTKFIHQIAELESDWERKIYVEELNIDPTVKKFAKFCKKDIHTYLYGGKRA